MTPLFRREALEYRSERLHGDVTFAVPRSWQLIGLLLFAAVVIAFAFLLLAPYSRVETVAGAIVPDRGISNILATRTGFVASIAVRDGAPVRAGDRLITIRSPESTLGGRPVQSALTAAIARQDSGLAGQSAQIQSAAAAEQSRIAAQVAGLRNELAALDEQIAVQRQLVETARVELENARIVAARGFISRRDIQLREDSHLTRRQQLAQLQQARSGKAAALEDAQRSVAEAAAQALAQVASIQSARAELSQRLVNAESAGTYVLRAPVEGTVTALTARIGQPVGEDSPLLSIVPAASRFLAELQVPTRAAGFLEPGQEVRIAIDAFPYQRFGTVRGRIEHISTAPVQRPDAQGRPEPVYLVTVRLAESGISARGRTYALISGMTLSARIVTQRQSLFEWLFEPLLSIRRR